MDDPTRRRNAERPSDSTTQALKLWVVLSRAFDSITAHLQADVSRHDLTLTEFGILEVLYHKGPMLLGEVQRRILVSSGGVTYLVDRLERKGLVERRACPEDRRARYAALTATGEALISKIFPEHATRIDTLFGELDADERQTLHRLLRQVGLSAARCPPSHDRTTPIRIPLDFEATRPGLAVGTLQGRLVRLVRGASRLERDRSPNIVRNLK